MIKDVDAEKLAVNARSSISKYCFSECKAYCCRSGHLLLTAKEVNYVLKEHKKDLKKINVLTAVDRRRYVFSLGESINGCPNLKDYKCIMHKDPLRPKACKEFPLFIWKNKTVMVSFKCPAAKDNQLYPYLAKFKKMGYKIVYSME